MTMMKLMKLPLASYDVIQFKSKDNGIRGGYAVGDELVVAVATPINNDKYRIFSRNTGRPIIRVNFETRADAITFAEFLEELLSEYWIILTEYPDADIPSLVQYTIPDGQEFNFFIKQLEADTNRKWTIKDIFSEPGNVWNEPS